MRSWRRYFRACVWGGQYIDTSLLEAALAYTIWESNEYWATGMSPQRLGTAHRLAAPYQVFETASGWIAIGAANQRNWELLVMVLDRPDLLQNAAFATNADRMANLAQLVETLTATLKTRTTEEWSQVFDEAGVPSGPVLALSEVYQHPHVKASQHFGHQLLIAQHVHVYFFHFSSRDCAQAITIRLRAPKGSRDS
jgi:crotonobetainyl-CoA:carnitine CoA-transferase CaiB-like acyl-CoA transferase